MRLLLQLMTDFPTFYILQLAKFLPVYIPEAWKRNSFRAEPRRTGHYREYPSTSVNPNTTESAELIDYQTVHLTFL